MHHRFIWPISIFVGGCVGVLVLWIMSSMVEVEPSILLDQPANSGVELIRTRHQCNKKFTELNEAVNNSKSCQIDQDCILVMDGNLTFNQCFISIQRGKAELVSAKLGEFKTHCRHSWMSGCGHSFAGATCQNRVCTVEYIEGAPRISLEKLKQQTIKSITDNL